MSTHNLCFGAKIRKNVYPCKLQVYYIKVGCKGVFITQTCLHDVVSKRKLLVCYSFVFIAVHDKRLFDPLVLLPDVYVCFRNPGTRPCQFLHV